MNSPYNFVFTASTFRSPQMAINFLNSLDKLQAHALCVFVSPMIEDLNAIHNAHTHKEYILIHTDLNSLYFGRAWGFAWAVNNDVWGEYLVTCDDDLIWNDNSHLILPRIRLAEQRFDFCLMSVNSTHPRYPTPYLRLEDDYIVGTQWVDGNAVFSRWQDNLDYGVIDGTWESPRLFFVEMEYSHRMRFLTGRPIVHDNRRIHHYIHVFRADPYTNTVREETIGDAMQYGNGYWKKKFNIDVKINSDCDHESIYDASMKEDNRPLIEKSMLFNRKWNEWDKIYGDYKYRCRVVYDTRRQG